MGLTNSLMYYIATNVGENYGLQNVFLNMIISNANAEAFLTKRFLSYAHIVGMKSIIRGVIY